MIDTRLLLDDFDETARRLMRKGVDRGLLEDARRLALERRQQVQQVDSLREERNARSGEIGALMRADKKDEAQISRDEMAAAGRRLDELEAALKATEAEVDDVTA